MATPRKTYVMVPKDITRNPKITRSMLASYVYLLEAFQDRWREEGIVDPADACEILLNLDKLRSICTQKRLKSTRKELETLGELVGFSIEFESELTRIRWPKVAELLRLPTRNSGNVRAESGQISGNVRAMFGQSSGTNRALREDVDLKSKTKIHTPRSRPTQKGHARAQSVEGDVKDVEKVDPPELHAMVSDLERASMRKKVRDFYESDLLLFAIAEGQQWPAVGNVLADLMVECVFQSGGDLGVLMRMARGSLRYFKDLGNEGKKLGAMWAPSTVYSQRHCAKYLEYEASPSPWPERDFNDMTPLEKQAMFARQGKLRGPLPEKK